jgi:hypothetical protein
MNYAKQLEAKTGDFIESFESKSECIDAGKRMEILAARRKVRRQLAYTYVPARRGRRGTWQIYLMP